MAVVHSRWSRIRLGMAGAAAILSVALSVAAITTQRPVYALAGAAFALIPIAYGFVAATGRLSAASRVAFVLCGGVSLAAVAVGGWMALRSCDNRLGPGASLAGCDFSNVAVAHEDLAGADLTAADLSGADLTSADLGEADATKASFVEATLRSADLSGAQLIGADLRGADLSFADLFGADLSEAILTDATLEDATLTQATFTGADLAGLDLFGVSIPGSDLSGADLTDVVLDKAALNDARFAEATMDGASLVRAHMAEADLTSASLASADLSRADLTGANLMGTDLSGAKLDGASLVRVQGLDDADLANALGIAEEDFPEALAKRNISLENRDEILSSLAGACRGGVREAASFEGRGFHPAMVLGANGASHNFTDDVPGSWEPKATRFAQLVACVGQERRDLVETCGYFNPDTGASVAPVRRFTRLVTVKLVAARTGKLVDQRVFSRAPEPCSFQVFGDYDTTLVGDKITFSTIRGWLGGHVR